MSKDNSRLLIDEHPLQVLPTLACKVGLNAAIVLQQVHYWLVIAKKAKDERKFKDGRWWVYNSYKEWQDNFPWWSLPTIKRAIYKLEEMKLLISREMNAQDWDHTKWYTIDYGSLNDLTDCINMIPSEDSNLDDQGTQNDTLLKESETTTKTTPLIIKLALELFKGYFGKFNNRKELDRWVILYEAAGPDRAEELLSWASKKEIELTNRPSLLDSLETAAKNWQDKPARANGNGKKQVPTSESNAEIIRKVAQNAR